MPVTLTSADCAESKAMVQLRRMVALSAAFQAKVDDDYDACLARVMYEGVPNDSLAESEESTAPSADKPFASIWLVSTGWRMVAGGSQNHLVPTGMLHLYLLTPRVEVASEGWNDARLEAVQFLGNWEADIVALFGADDTSAGTKAIVGEGHLAGTLSDTPSHEHVAKQIRDSAGDFFFRHVAISYGDVAGGA